MEDLYEMGTARQSSGYAEAVLIYKNEDVSKLLMVGSGFPLSKRWAALQKTQHSGFCEFEKTGCENRV